ncbi:beta-lactamase/transpeptidase-like protein [Fusarium acuminatum]|uniref:Beta-lactamase/transpeptidase-like protein n=1 Tax=Fusarium acuminatum TaxID=5515 RepID=A0ABZ2XBK2_9HYPO
MPSFSKLAVAAAGAFAFADAKACPPLGAVFPAPLTPGESPLVQKAAAAVKAGLDATIAAQFNNSGLAIGVKSIHEDEPLFTYHFTPPNPGEGTTKIDEDTVFRIASGSKLFTALAALISDKIDIDASVLKYLPELNKTAGDDDIFSLKWEDITVKSLASHLSGVGVDMAQDLAIVGSEPWKAFGLPNIPKGKGPNCSGLPGTIPCTRKDLLEQVNLRPPVYGPFTNPIYSNVGHALLGLVIEAAEDMPYEDVIKRDILDVVGMKHTYVDKTPPTKDLFIPNKEPTWNSTLSVFDAAGGIFSSVSDMLLLADGILSNKFLTPVQTRKWMKPEANTASWGYQVGGPWEILKSDNITSDGRLIDIYTKSGDLGLYHSQTVLIPDYDIVISIMSGGLEASANPYVTGRVLSAVIQNLLPAIEKVGRDDAKVAFAGEYEDKETNSSISFQSDSGPGLKIKSWQVRGFDVLNNIGNFNFNALESGASTKTPYVDARMYPSNLAKKGQTAWRAVFDKSNSTEDAAYDSTLFFKDGTCQTWFQQDRMVYDYLPLDLFVFTEGEDGVSESVKSPAFNVTLTKVRQPAQKKATGEGDRNAAGEMGRFGVLGFALAAAATLMSTF